MDLCRITNPFEMAKKKSVSLLDLPSSVRHKIYRFTGITRPCSIDIGSEGLRHRYVASDPEKFCWYYPRPKENPWNFNEHRAGECTCFCEPIPLQLLACRRRIRDELIPILYGENSFKLHWTEEGQRFFTQLSKTALASLSRLQISHVNASSPGLPHSILKKKCIPSKLFLSLQFLGDDQAYKTTQQCKRLPVLRAYAITCADFRGRLPRDVRRNLCLRTVSDRKTVDFPLMKLPKEIRLIILEHTGLVSKALGSLPVNPLSIRTETRRPRNNPRVFYTHKRVLGIGKRCCWTCSPSPATQCCCIDENRMNNTVRGYSSSDFVSSSACSCFYPPFQIFRVCRQLSAEAREVFFAQNRFILDSSPGGCLQFLRTQRQDSLSRIRLLELSFELGDLAELAMLSNQAQLEWEQLIAFISDNFTLSNLFLTLRSQRYEDDLPFSWKYGDRPDWTTDELAVFYETLSKLLSRLRGAYRFFAVLGWAHQFETRLERHVMGDDYDSAKHGKLAHGDRESWDHRQCKVMRN